MEDDLVVNTHKSTQKHKWNENLCGYVTCGFPLAKKSSESTGDKGDGGCPPQQCSDLNVVT